MKNFRVLGAPPPDARASSSWGLCPQTPSLRRLGALPPDPQNSPPIANFRLRAWEVIGSNFAPGQIGHSVANAHHRCDISSKGAKLPARNDAEMDPTNSLHASA